MMLLLFKSSKPDVVFLDIDFHGVPLGWDILKLMKQVSPEVIVIIITGSYIPKSSNLGKEADKIFEKPIQLPVMHSFLIQKGLMAQRKAYERGELA